MSAERNLLRRIREWDMLPTVADGPFWMAEIDKVLSTNESEEICICAAIKMPDGYIVRGQRHDSCMLTAGRMERYKDKGYHTCVQGFVTSTGRFVDRKEGMSLQKAANMHSYYAYDGVLNGDELFSEDLYE